VGFAAAVTCEDRGLRQGDSPWRLPRVDVAHRTAGELLEWLETVTAPR